MSNFSPSSPLSSSIRSSSDFTGSIAIQPTLDPSTAAINIFASELMTGETLIWAGQPSTRVFFRKTDWGMIPFSFLWGGFAIFWEWGASGHFANASRTTTSPPLFFTLWGIPFVLMGQYMIWGRFFYTAWRKRRTWYAVTNKRVLVLGGRTSFEVVDGSLRSLESIFLSLRPDGIGTIEFSPEPYRTNWFGGNRTRFDRQMQDIDLGRLCFYDVPNARELHRLIQTLRDRASSG